MKVHFMFPENIKLTLRITNPSNGMSLIFNIY